VGRQLAWSPRDVLFSRKVLGGAVPFSKYGRTESSPVEEIDDDIHIMKSMNHFNIRAPPKTTSSFVFQTENEKKKKIMGIQLNIFKKTIQREKLIHSIFHGILFHGFLFPSIFL
jgi:hypothetical protein